MNTLEVLGLPLVNTSKAIAVTNLLSRSGQTVAHFINAHCVNVAVKHKAYAASLRCADYLLPDGSGISLAARLKGQRFQDNLNGTDLFLPLCEAAARQGKSIFLLGAAPGVAEAAAQNACDKVDGLTIAGTAHGYFDPEQSGELIAKINNSGADVLLVAMGVPMQELWVQQHRDQLRPRLIMGVGAQFDFHSGRVTRAPQIMRRLGCEWLWRLALEPRRMAHRYIIGNPLFIGRAVRRAMIERTPTVASVVKRSIDIACSGSALLLLSPVFLGTAAAIRLNSAGPVLFRQARVGLNGETFTMFKFRSMFQDAEARRAAMLARSDRDGVCFKAKTDPRITPVGRILRRFSLDELPQLINVFLGQMSLVGPRPALQEEVDAYPKEALGRLAVKPGITGLWQVAGRADIGFDKMIDMDLAYVRSRSILLDFVILALTGRAVISGRGAY